MGRSRSAGRALGTAAVVFAIASVPSCGDDLPPPLEDGHHTNSPDSGATTGFDFDGGIRAPNCDQVQPDGGICACLDQPLLIDPPTLYFVLDRSGSMGDFGNDGKSKWADVVQVVHDLVVALGPRAKFGVATFPAVVNPQGCAAGVEVVSPRQGDAPAGKSGPTADYIWKVLSGEGVAGGTPTAATLSSLYQHVQSLPGHTYVILATDGGANCNATASCTAADCEFNIESTQGCPPGGPPNCCDPNVNKNGQYSCLDAAPTIAAVQAYAKANIPVYVVGIPGSEPYAVFLDKLAQAGGTARSSEPLYYAVDSISQAAFEATLKKVAAKITATCVFDLGQAPPDPSLVNVFLDGTVLPQQGNDGWTIDGSKVTILGASCQKILDGDVLDVEIAAGCPTVLR